MKKSMNRWIYAIVGVIVLAFAGMIYAWSVLSGPMVNQYPGWTDSRLTWGSTIVMVCFCLAGFFGGLMQKKCSIKINLILSAVLFVVGFGITSITSSIFVVYIGFGVLGGFASGFAYNAVMSTVSGWFPDKQGLISGILLMGFGIGSFIVGKIYTGIVQAGTAWQTCFLWIGIICGVIIAIGALLLNKPSAEQIASLSQGAAIKKAEPYEELPPGQMIRRASFWLMFIWAILVSVAGLAVIFLGRPIAVAAVPSLAETPGIIATVVGLISVSNAVSRIVFGGLFDKIGYKLTLIICAAMFILSMGLIILAMNTGSLVILFVSYIMTGFSYGGVTPSLSAFVNKFYGAKYYPVNLSIMVMNLIISSFGTKLADFVHTQTNSYIVVLLGVAGICVIAIILALLIRKPNKELK